LDKACEVLGIRLIHVPVDPKTSRFCAKAARKRMSSDTILIYASAPSFPHGTIDPIEDLSKLALEYNCGLHVDCCLGGFFLPFLNKLGPGYALKDKFDFGCKGVTSISVDTHKYGFAAKGTSVVLYRNIQLRHCQYFAFPKWTGGLYISTLYVCGLGIGIF
jgi:glutamate/tyrosine decarboxylase-like PLP-dependent enzyme